MRCRQNKMNAIIKPPESSEKTGISFQREISFVNEYNISPLSYNVNPIQNLDTASIIEKGKSKKVEIKNVIETPQNRFLSRQNRLAKGVIIETSAGKARITNRPSREGCVNAVLIKDSK